VARRNDGTIDVNGRTPVELLEQEIGNMLSEDERREIDTVGGLIFSLLGRIPERGEVVRHPSGVEFEVLDVDPRRIRRLRVRPPNTAPAVP
jgi:CBS domain containing-hemolysin-like protein